MTDKTGKAWMAIGETDDPDVIIETYVADAAITKGDPVYLSADDQVTPAGAAQDCIGIARETVADTEPCPVIIRGRVKVKAGGAITRGKAVYGADAAQKVLMLTDLSQAVDGVELQNIQLRFCLIESLVTCWRLLMRITI